LRRELKVGETLREQKAIVSIDNLSFRYASSKRYALKNVNLEIYEGEFILLMGPSGCGKTTLIRCINGLIPHFYSGEYSGKVRVFGVDVQESSPEKLSEKVGTVFQNPENQLFCLSVRRELAFGLENRLLPPPKIKQIVEETLEKFRMKHIADKAPYELSGGEQQKVAIASILVMRPKLLLLDEPTSNLDPISAVEVISFLKELSSEGISILISEHRSWLLAPIVDRVIIMDNGHIVLDGSPEEVFYNDKALGIGIEIPPVVEFVKTLSRKIRLPKNWRPLKVHELSEIAKYVSPIKCDSLPQSPPIKAEGKTILDVKDVWFKYEGGDYALKGVSMKIFKGDRVAIMGSNGAGKTTLIRAIMNLVKIEKGSIVFNEKIDLTKLPTSKIARFIGVCFQNPDHQIFSETVFDEVAFLLRNLRYPENVVRQRVKRILTMLDLDKYAESSPFMLSEGERKRVALASILVGDPDILILDEPTLGQDRFQKERLKRLLEQLTLQGKTIIVTTHDIEFSLSFFKRIILMSNGKVIADGSPLEIFTNENVLRSANLIKPDVVKIRELLKDIGIGTPLHLSPRDLALEIISTKGA